MQIKLYNTYTTTVEDFSPFKATDVSMYVCGVTPYDTSHLGHAFVFVVFDVLKRFLTQQKYRVNYVQNVTDIDDPLIEKAKEQNTTSEALAEKWTNYLLNDFRFLNIMMPDHYIKASDEVEMMQTIITGLLDNKHAYVNEGNVYFDLTSFPDYGKLSKYPHAEMLKIAAERGGDIKDPLKKNPLDFLLWKKSAPGEPKWPSPWSEGRPGWHIECTAMSMKYLGEQIDIHGGGSDLIYPHHESEIAQAEGYTHKHPFVKTWMHVAMVSQDGEKMSKSLGNLTYVQDLAKNYSANAIRYYLLSHHYRQEWEYKPEEMKVAADKTALIEKNLTEGPVSPEILEALANDLNIPLALDLLSKNPTKAGWSLLGFS